MIGRFLKGLGLLLVLDWLFTMLIRIAFGFGGWFWVSILGAAVSVVSLLTLIRSKNYRLISFIFLISGLIVAAAATALV